MAILGKPDRRWVFITWYPYCRRSDALGDQLGARSYLVHYLRFKTPALAPLKYLLQAFRTAVILGRETPAGVLVASPPVIAPLIVWICSWFLGFHFVVDAHSGIFLHRRWKWALPLQRFLSHRALATIVTNQYMADIVRSWGAKVAVVQDLALDLNPSGKASRADGFSVVFICTYSADEPVESVVEAARRLPDVILTITGDPSYAPRGFTTDLPPNVRLTGFVPDQEYLSHLRGADVVMVLTRDDHTMQRGAYEAVALEKPLITSDWSLLRQVFSKGTVHVDNTAEAIVAAIRRIQASHGVFKTEIAELRKARAAASAIQVGSLQRLCQEEAKGGESI